MKSHGFTDRSMFEPEERQHPNAPVDPAATEMLPIVVVLMKIRPKSLLVHALEDDPSNSAWLPRSQIEVEPNMGGPGKSGDRFRIKAPRWLLQREGLIAFAGEGQGRLF